MGPLVLGLDDSGQVDHEPSLAIPEQVFGLPYEASRRACRISAPANGRVVHRQPSGAGTPTRDPARSLLPRSQ